MGPVRGYVEYADSNTGYYIILGAIGIHLPPPWWWITDHLDQPGAKGAIFRAYPDVNSGLDIANITIAEVTDDPTEPDVNTLLPNDVPALDAMFERDITADFAARGVALTRWMSSHLNVTPDMKGLVTAYIVHDQGKDRQFIALRVTRGERKFAALGCFDIAMQKELSGQIFGAMRGLKFL